MPEAFTMNITTDGKVQDPTHPFSFYNLSLLEGSLKYYTASENQLVNASARLLSLCATLNRLRGAEVSNKSRTKIARDIIELKYKVVKLDYPPAVAENLCLLFAIVVDEFVLNGGWDDNSQWKNMTLVADLFGFRDGGDRFYRIAERALMQPKLLRDFLYIVYLFLKMGYRGRYLVEDDRERNILITRIENTLDISREVERSKKEVLLGRCTKKYKSPSKRLMVSHKVVWALFSIILINVIAAAGKFQFRNSNTERWDMLRGQVVRTTEFIYSSETDSTTRADR